MPIRVFIIEDHPSMQEAYAMLVEREPELDLRGMAGSAEEALPMLRQTPCDVVLVDVSLPGMSGIAFVSQLRTELPHLPALVISGHDDAAVARQALAAGARAYLAKLNLPLRLSETIRQVVREAAPPQGST